MTAALIPSRFGPLQPHERKVVEATVVEAADVGDEPDLERLGRRQAPSTRPRARRLRTSMLPTSSSCCCCCRTRQANAATLGERGTGRSKPPALGLQAILLPSVSSPWAVRGRATRARGRRFSGTPNRARQGFDQFGSKWLVCVKPCPRASRHTPATPRTAEPFGPRADPDGAVDAVGSRPARPGSRSARSRRRSKLPALD